MKVVFSVGTPHQAHVFRNAAKHLIDHGINVVFAARDYGCTLDLLSHYELPFFSYGTPGKSFLGKSRELVVSEYLGFQIVKAAQAQLVVGDSLLGFPSKLLGIPSIAFVDGDGSDFFNLQYRTLYRSDLICTPSGFRISIDKRHLRYPGYQELAYLHPRWFTPDMSSLDSAGIGKGEPFCIFRTNAFDAQSHDAMYRKYGWDDRRRLIRELSRIGKVVISSELELPADLREHRVRIQPYQIHDVLNQASLVVSETAMAVEAAILGTPSMFIHPSVGRNCSTNFVEMENYGLQRNYSGYTDDTCQDALELFGHDGKKHHSYLRAQMLKQKIDVTSFIIWLVYEALDDRRRLETVSVDFSKFL